jgi:nucleoside-diphosphate-sugar epimerase
MASHLVTGGAGFIGSSIAEALLRSGERVRILDNFSSGRRENVDSLPGKVELVEGTITDPETVRRALQGVEVVFHEAAIPSVIRSVEDPAASMLAGVQGTTVLLQGARIEGVRRVIFAASSSAYGDTPTLPKVESMMPMPLSPYAVSKLGCEHMMRVAAKLFGLETISLRYFNIFGPRQDPKSEYAAVIPKFFVAALRGEPPTVFGDGEQTRDFCYIDNAVSANLLAASSSRKLAGEVVNVACGERTSLNQLVSQIGSIVGVTLRPSYVPSRAGDIRDSLADVTLARHLIGYRPLVDLREGLRRTHEAMTRARS